MITDTYIRAFIYTETYLAADSRPDLSVSVNNSICRRPRME